MVNSLKVKDDVTMIKFGKYYKSNNNTLEPIEWDILYKDNIKTLLLSKYVIDAQAWDKLPFDQYMARYFKLAETYNTTEQIPITWSCCTLREWLNKDFYNLAFNSNERKNILLTENFTKDEKSIQGYKLTRVGYFVDDLLMIEYNDGFKPAAYNQDYDRNDLSIDYAAHMAGYISITPLTWDKTNNEQFELLKNKI